MFIKKLVFFFSRDILSYKILQLCFTQNSFFQNASLQAKLSSDKLNLLPKPGNSPKLAKAYNRTYSDSTILFQIEMSYLLVL